MSKNFWIAVFWLFFFAALNIILPAISRTYFDVLPMTEGVFVPTLLMMLVRVLDRFDEKTQETE